METRRNSAKKPRHSRESGNPLRAINFRISVNFTRKLSLEFSRIFLQKRGECGDLSVKMDSRFRGNDEVNSANFTRKLNLEFPYFFCKKRDECGDLSVKMDSRFRGNDEVNFANFMRKLNLKISVFFRKKRGEFREFYAKIKFGIS